MERLITLPQLKSFALTHILYDPLSTLSIPLSLLSLSPIFLFVSYFTLVVFTRRLTLFILALGSVANEGLSWGLKRVWKGPRPYFGYGEVGEGYGMPSSHTQAAAFLVAWGIGYATTLDRRYEGSMKEKEGRSMIRKWRTRVYVFGLVLWSLTVGYSRWRLFYHSSLQIAAGYAVGLLAGSSYFIVTEYIPMLHPTSALGRVRSWAEWMWEGVGGIGGWDLGTSAGGWGEGHFVLGPDVLAGDITDGTNGKATGTQRRSSKLHPKSD